MDEQRDEETRQHGVPDDQPTSASNIPPPPPPPPPPAEQPTQERRRLGARVAGDGSGPGNAAEQRAALVAPGEAGAVVGVPGVAVRLVLGARKQSPDARRAVERGAGIRAE